MTAAVIYRPDQWHDFFLMVGTGAAALTGLVFVALTLNLMAITGDPTHRYRAIGVLTGFTSVFMVCALVLMGGQDHRAVGAELFTISVVAAAVFINGYVQAAKSRRDTSLRRVSSGHSAEAPAPWLKSSARSF